MIWIVYFLNGFLPQWDLISLRQKQSWRGVLTSFGYIHSWLDFPNCFILTLRIFWPLNDSRSLKDDLPVIVLFRSSAVKRKATTRMSFRWENCVCCTSHTPPQSQLAANIFAQFLVQKTTSTLILKRTRLNTQELVPLWGSPMLPGGKTLNHSYC